MIKRRRTAPDACAPRSGAGAAFRGGSWPKPRRDALTAVLLGAAVALTGATIAQAQSEAVAAHAPTKAAGANPLGRTVWLGLLKKW